MYLAKIHSAVHKIMSDLYFSPFLLIEILAFLQNWTCKQEVGHCDLILQPIFFHSIILNSKVPFMLNTKYQPNLEKKLILLVLLFLAMAAILDSRPSGILSF